MIKYVIRKDEINKRRTGRIFIIMLQIEYILKYIAKLLTWSSAAERVFGCPFEGN